MAEKLNHLAKKVIPIAFRSIVLLVVVGPLVCVAATFEPYEARYTTKLKGIKITGVNKLERIANDTYRVSWNAKVLWMKVSEWSEFELLDGGEVRPLSYHYVRKGLGSNNPIHVYYDWQNQKLNGSKGNRKGEFPLAPGAHSKLSYQIQMQLDLQSKPELRKLKYNVITYGGKTRNYNFVFLNQEIINTGLGKVPARVYAKTNKDRTTTIWLSPERNFLPVQIEHSEHGESSVMTIKSWSSK